MVELLNYHFPTIESKIALYLLFGALNYVSISALWIYRHGKAMDRRFSVFLIIKGLLFAFVIPFVSCWWVLFKYFRVIKNSR